MLIRPESDMMRVHIFFSKRLCSPSIPWKIQFVAIVSLLREFLYSWVKAEMTTKTKKYAMVRRREGFVYYFFNEISMKMWARFFFSLHECSCSKSAYPLKPWVRSSKAMFVQSYLHMQLAKLRKKLLFGRSRTVF